MRLPWIPPVRLHAGNLTLLNDSSSGGGGPCHVSLDHAGRHVLVANYGGDSSGPYRGHKFTLWEGGIRVPCIISQPGRIPANAVRDQVAISIDWMPTIADYCGVPLPDRRIDGKKIVPIIESANARSPHEVLHWEFGKHWAVREGDWKLVHNGLATEQNGRMFPRVEKFLSNLTKDIAETKNLAENHPEIIQRLTGLHQQWTQEVQRQ